MTQYIPPSQTLPLPPAGGPGAYGARSRASSNASMNKYVPDSYRTPQPGSSPEQQGSYFPTPQRPRGPSIGGHPISSTPPFPNSFPGQGAGFPHQQAQSSFPGTPAYTPGGYTPGTYTPAPGPPYPQAVNELRPPEEPRRRSDASTHSRHSPRSRHSSRRRDGSLDRADRRRRSYEDEDDYEYEKERRRRQRERERRSSAPDPEGKDKLRRERTRPTLGDTVYSSFRNIKYWLGPRDKY